MRKKSRRAVREVRVPVTRSILDSMAEDMRFAMMAIETGFISGASFRKIAKPLLTVSAACEMVAIEARLVTSSLLTLDDISGRFTRSGVWRASKFDLLSLRNGLNEAEALIPSLSINVLSAAYVAVIKEQEVTHDPQRTADC